MPNNIIFICCCSLALFQACKPSPPDEYSHIQRKSSLNLGYETLTNEEEPEEWLILSKSGQVRIVVDEKLAFQDKNCLYFQSRTREKSQCLNFILADIVCDSVEISVHAKFSGDTTSNFGFFYQSNGVNIINDPVFTEVNILKNGETWKRCNFTILKNELNGPFLDFGFWVEGTVDLWLDDWDVRVDREDYDFATQKSVLPLNKTSKNYISENLIPLNINEHTFKIDNFDWLSNTIEGADIILLGEATHGTSDFIKLRTEITKFLVEEMNFTTIALEANLPEALNINDKIGLNPGDRERMEMLNNLHFWMYRTNEYLDLLEWFEKLNKEEFPNVKIAGCDMQYYDFAIAELNTLSLQYSDQKLNNIISELQANLSHSENVIFWADSLVDHLKSQSLSSSLEAKNAMDLKRMIRYAIVILDALTLESVSSPYVLRERKMAENIAWLANQDGGHKVVVWAHNGHVQRAQDATGFWLSQQTEKKKIFSIGLATGSGTYHGLDIRTGEIREAIIKSPPPESWEYYFQQTGIDAFYLNLNGPNCPLSEFTGLRMRDIGAVATPKQFYPANITEKFDAVIYLDSTSASHFY